MQRCGGEVFYNRGKGGNQEFLTRRCKAAKVFRFTPYDFVVGAAFSRDIPVHRGWKAALTGVSTAAEQVYIIQVSYEGFRTARMEGHVR